MPVYSKVLALCRTEYVVDAKIGTGFFATKTLLSAVELGPVAASNTDAITKIIQFSVPATNDEVGDRLPDAKLIKA